MSQYDNTNTGALFINDKGGNEKRPDRKGTLNVEGVEYQISGWIREKKNGGEKFLSLKVERKNSQPEPGRDRTPADAYRKMHGSEKQVVHPKPSFEEAFDEPPPF